MIKLIVAIALALIAYKFWRTKYDGFGLHVIAPGPREPGRAGRGIVDRTRIAMWIMIMLAAMTLISCSTTGARDRALIAASQAAVTLPSMSESELTCAAEPGAPSPRGGAARVRESQVTGYILDLREAGADCRDKLGVARRVWRKVEDVKSRAMPPATKGESK